MSKPTKTDCKFRAHTIYRNSQGKRVPSVTTITGELGWSKRTLIDWANNLGLEGIDAKTFVDDKADIGTLAHLMITNKLTGLPTDTDDYSKNQITAAENSVKSFESWASDKKLEVIFVEKQLTSDKHNFGGTCDIFAKVDGVIELIDLKTGKGIYEEHLIQVGGGYDILLEEHDHIAERIRILNIPRVKGERFSEEEIINRPVCRKIFFNCLDNYKIKKELRKEALNEQL